jgi:hypothetical protein
MAKRKPHRSGNWSSHKGDKRYVRWNSKGEFNKEVDVGPSFAAN